MGSPWFSVVRTLTPKTLGASITVYLKRTMTVFLSYTPGDERYAAHFAAVLDRVVGAEPFIPKLPSTVGEDTVEKIKKGIDKCGCMIPIITANTIQNDTLQDQEIGYATAKKKQIIPIKEKSVILQGFLAGSGYIVLRPDDLDLNTYELLVRIRNVFHGLEVRVRCKSCNHHFQIFLPNQKYIDNAIKNNLMFSPDCPKCYKKVPVEPKTLTSASMQLHGSHTNPNAFNRYKTTEFGFGY